MKFIIFGTVLSPRAFSYNLAANPASTKWLRGFVDGLQENNVEVTLCGRCYAQAWPRGPFFSGKQEYLDANYENHLIRFCNVPGIRFTSMAHSYYRVASRLVQSSVYDAVVTYNPYPWHVSAARKLKRDTGMSWLCLNLDFEDVGARWQKFIKGAGDADGHLFLSHWGFENAPVEKKIHLDSGIGKLPEGFGGLGTTEPFTIVYLGKLTKSGGLDVLLRLPELISDNNVRFVYGGKGYPSTEERLKALANKDSRVEYLGFVDEKDVPRLFHRAAVFLNPRDPEDVVNDMVFPSKIMEYLKHGKTVVSTWTKGLEPAYRDLMLIADSPSPEDFAFAVQRAINEPSGSSMQRAQKIRGFLENSRVWRNQAKRFVDFARPIISRDLSN